MKESTLSHAFILQHITYCPKTGKFTKNCKPLHGLCPRGYVQFSINGVPYRGHRVAIFYMTGQWPPRGYDVDHINRNKSDNRWSNLRLVSRSENNFNSGPRADNTTGVKGVSQIKSSGKYRAYITLNGRQRHIGVFKTLLGAATARSEYELRLLNY